MNNFSCKIKVRYSETDQMGRVYYSHYLVFFEVARTEYLTHLGMPYSELEAMGFYLPVSESYCKYHMFAKYEDVLFVEVNLTQLKGASLRLDYIVRREKDDELIATGYTVHPIVNLQGKVVRIPEKLRDLLLKDLQKI